MPFDLDVALMFEAYQTTFETAACLTIHATPYLLAADSCRSINCWC
jgi:hypothetical protein